MPTTVPTDTTVIVRFDPDQVDECRVTYEAGLPVVTFGPNPFTPNAMLGYTLRSMVTA